VLVGKLVRYTDWDSSAGFAVPEETLGLVVSISDSSCIPMLVDILLPEGMLTVYEDDLIEAY
jgi:hypothetical protein